MENVQVSLSVNVESLAEMIRRIVQEEMAKAPVQGGTLAPGPRYQLDKILSRLDDLEGYVSQVDSDDLRDRVETLENDLERTIKGVINDMTFSVTVD